MHWRVETLGPIHNPTVHAQVLEVSPREAMQSWERGASTWLSPRKNPFSAHECVTTNPSLSGYGVARDGRGVVSPLAARHWRQDRVAED